jgi:hypothetical protein
MQKTKVKKKGEKKLIHCGKKIQKKKKVQKKYLKKKYTMDYYYNPHYIGRG